MSILDTIVSQYGASVSVVSEQNDLSQAAPSAPKGDELERTRTVAQTIRRANLGANNGKVTIASALTVPWHGLGTVTSGAMTADEAYRMAHLDIFVDSKPIYWTDDLGGRHEIADKRAIVRRDTNDIFAVMGDGYQILQNADAAKLLDSVLGESGAHYETAGALGRGERIWFLAKLPGEFSVGNPDDVQQQYLCITNSHNGKEAIRIFSTSVRIVCQNTYVASSKGGSFVSIRHTRNAAKRIDEHKAVLASISSSFARYREQMEMIAERKAPDVSRVVNATLDEICDITQEQISDGPAKFADVLRETDRERAANIFAKRVRERREAFDDIVTRYKSDTCAKSFGENGWTLLQAITEYADHSMPTGARGNEIERREKRFDSALFGRAAEVKQIAASKVISLTA